MLRTDDPEESCFQVGVVPPGVGAFGDFMSGSRARGLEEAVNDTVQARILCLESVLGCRRCSKSAKRWVNTRHGVTARQGREVC
ncbi:hypothetical protein [Candidatus Villigracilis saccharophilus]|uniref:hypothetical protein n=1 Tax=Candidatus Villigracilis saccharophilus TaxID=3140684 RepID=UPI003134A991|nr:hypothetical protein [Anaerolineales bacterium]